ncbi:MAG: hypothetical protein ACLFUS_17880, partial [Candidatus Sumerlaeia bacterium]
MIFRPTKDGRLWDSWLLLTDEEIHLYYLANQEGDQRIGHCTSTDMVHWKRHADILPPHWPFTGMIIPKDDKYFLFVGEAIDGCQTTVLYESTDLENWKRVKDEPVIRPALPYYRSENPPWGKTVAWRDPYVFYRPEDGYYHTIICASRPVTTPDDTGSALGHARSKDLVNWELLPPIDAPTHQLYHAEVPEYFEIDGTHYIIFTTGSVYGIRLNTPSRRESVGTYYMIADSFEGPYHLPEEPLLVGSAFYKMASYVGRRIVFRGESLMYHHIRDDSSGWFATWAPPKRLVQLPNRELVLKYWPGLEALETADVREGIESVVGGAGEAWSRSGGTLKGRAMAMGQSCILAEDMDDYHIRVTIKSTKSKRCGLVFRVADNRGIQFSMDYELGQIELGYSRQHHAVGWGADITGFVPCGAQRNQQFIHDQYRTTLEHGKEYNVRVFLRDQHLEAYLDDQWIFTSVFPHAALNGNIEAFVECGEMEIQNLRIARIEPL